MQGFCVLTRAAHQVHLARAGDEHEGARRAGLRQLCDVPVEVTRALDTLRVRRVLDVQRVGHRFRGHDARAHVLGERASVEGGGHGGEVEIVAKHCDLHAHGQHQVGVQLALVDLVEDDCIDSLKPRILEQAVKEYARGDELDERAVLMLAADGVANFLAQS